MMGPSSVVLETVELQSRQCDPRTVCRLGEHSWFSQCTLVYFNTLVYEGNEKSVLKHQKASGFVWFFCRLFISQYIGLCIEQAN